MGSNREKITIWKCTENYPIQQATLNVIKNVFLCTTCVISKYKIMPRSNKQKG